MFYQFKKLVFLLVIFCLSLMLTITWETISQGQVFSARPELIDFFQSQGIRNPLNEGQIGNLVYAPVKLDGEILFVVASPASSNTQTDEKKISPLKQRVQSVESKLEGILQRGFEPETLQVTSAILNGETVILVSDGKFLQPQPLITITAADTQLYGLPISELTQQATKYIHSRLIQAWEERQSDYLLHQGLKAALIFWGTITFSILLLIWRKHLIKQLHHYQEIVLKVISPEKLEDSNSNNLSLVNKDKSISGSETPEERMIKIQGKLETLRQKIKPNILLRRLLFFGQLFLWGASFSIILKLFPYTRNLGIWLLGMPSQLLFIWFIVVLINKVIESLLDFSYRSWQQQIKERLQFNLGSERDILRLSTLTNAIQGVASFLIIIIGIIVTLQAAGIPIAPLLAGAGIVGFAISFGSQNLIKSMIVGISNLLIDSYAVGDWVILDEVSGQVEKMNLFFTQIRSSNGDLITIPNSLIGIIQNQTKDWSKVNLTIQVAYETNLDQALKVIDNVAQQLFNDAQWQSLILEPPELLGVENLDYSGIAIRINIKTQAGQQWKVSRELRHRLKEKFEQEGINIGVPRQSLSIHNLTDFLNSQSKP